MNFSRSHRTATSNVQHGGGSAQPATRHDGDESLDVEPIESPGGDTGQPAPQQQQQQRPKWTWQQQQWQFAVEPRLGESRLRWATREPDGESAGESTGSDDGPNSHTKQRGGGHWRQWDDVQAGAQLREPETRDALPGGHCRFGEELERPQGQGQDTRETRAADGLEMRIVSGHGLRRDAVSRVSRVRHGSLSFSVIMD